MESLEQRRVMAGNVLAEVIDGTLYLDGDDAANGIAIVGTETPGEFRVTGTPAVYGDVTYLNDQTESLTFVVTGDIVIRTFAGNDGVELNNVHLPGDLTIETGDGLDRVSVGSTLSAMGVRSAPHIAWPPAGEVVPGALVADPRFEPHFSSEQLPPIYMPASDLRGEVDIAGDVSIKTGAASDYVYLGCTHITGDLAVRTENGEDIFVMRTVLVRNLDAGLGRDHDLVNLGGLNTRGQMTLETSFGNDFVSFAAAYVRGQAAFLGGHDNNQFYIAGSVFSGPLYAQFGADHDRLSINSSMLLGNTTLVTGGGNDRIDIDYTFGRFVSADTSTGNDAISIRGSALDNIFAIMGDGDDHLSLVVSRIMHPFSSDGGNGGNDVVHEYGSVLHHTGLPGFEQKVFGWPGWLNM